jgi:hypothetical protein
VKFISINPKPVVSREVNIGIAASLRAFYFIGVNTVETCPLPMPILFVYTPGFLELPRFGVMYHYDMQGYGHDR